MNIAVDDATIDKTTAKSRTFKPCWNETFDLSVIEARSLQLTVFNRAVLSNDEFVANASLSFEDFVERYKPYQPRPGVMEADLWVNFSLLFKFRFPNSFSFFHIKTDRFRAKRKTSHKD